MKYAEILWETTLKSHNPLCNKETAIGMIEEAMEEQRIACADAFALATLRIPSDCDPEQEHVYLAAAIVNAEVK